jgi:hypothetical protein
MASDPEPTAVTEYHVVYSQKNNQWQVEYDGQTLGYPAWDKRVATSAAKQMATKKRPSKVVVHDRKGPAQSEIPYPAKPQKGKS